MNTSDGSSTSNGARGTTMASDSLRCFDHPDADAAGICAVCGRPVCAICRRMLGSKIACPPCATQCVADLAAAPATECSNLGEHIEHSTERPHLHRGDTLTTRPPDTLTEATTLTSGSEENFSSTGNQRYMKDPASAASALNCHIHPRADAVAVCVSCGKPVCASCRRTLGVRTYCPTCAQQRLAAGNQVRMDYGTYATPSAVHSGTATAAGACNIIGGAIGLLIVLAVVLYIMSSSNSDLDASAPSSTSENIVDSLFVASVPLVLFTLSIVGGICALKRQKWGLALAGGICGLVASIPLGIVFPGIFNILGIVFVAKSKDEFKKKPSHPW